MKPEMKIIWSDRNTDWQRESGQARDLQVHLAEPRSTHAEGKVHLAAIRSLLDESER